jgi:hypothetical protein
MSKSRRGLAGVITALALALTGSVAADAAVATQPVPVAHAACMNAKIGGQSKCIAAGQFCARQYERDYNRYGFTCNNRDANGRYHLRRR